MSHLCKCMTCSIITITDKHYITPPRQRPVVCMQVERDGVIGKYSEKGCGQITSCCKQVLPVEKSGVLTWMYLIYRQRSVLASGKPNK